MSDRLEEIKRALADPAAPWYGSDLVEWVGDLIAEVERLRRERDEALAAMGADTAAVVLAKCIADRNADEARAEVERLQEALKEYRMLDKVRSTTRKALEGNK